MRPDAEDARGADFYMVGDFPHPPKTFRRFCTEKRRHI